MGFKVTVSEDGGYIVGRVDGQLTIEVAQKLAEQYTKQIESTGIKRILNDVRGVRSEMSTVEDYYYAYSDVQGIGLPRGIKAAILADEGDTSHEFQETVARNAGYDVKIFFSYDQAVRWLTEGCR